jgi:hypothetical protein
MINTLHVCILHFYRDKSGAEKLKIETGESPVWTLAWNPAVRGSWQQCTTQ